MSTLRSLYSQVCDDIRSRQQWLSRQGTWYAMRHNGLRRQHKPWPGASDLHYPLADTIIEKLKPFIVAADWTPGALTDKADLRERVAPVQMDLF